MSLPYVLSYPPRHPYVDRLNHHAAVYIHRNEPLPRLPHFYAVEWLHAHRDDWQITHFHFGWEQYDLSHISRVIKTHQTLGKPLVVTVHDTRNPHTLSHELDQNYLRVLLSAASAVATLTPSAATHLRDTYGVQARIIPHGPLLSRAEMQTFRTLRADNPSQKTVYIHVKGGRKNLEWVRLLSLAPAVERATGLQLIFGIMRESPAHDMVKANDAIDDRYVELQPPLDDPQLYEKMAHHSALLLPYAWGSHSGFIELAKDLGIPAIVYDTGHYRDQYPAGHVAHSKDDNALLSSLVAALTTAPSWHAPTIDERMAELASYHAAYADIYASLV